MASTLGNSQGGKKNHIKSRSEAPLISDINSLTSRKYVKDNKIKITDSKEDIRIMRTVPIGDNLFPK